MTVFEKNMGDQTELDFTREAPIPDVVGKIPSRLDLSFLNPADISETIDYVKSLCFEISSKTTRYVPDTNLVIVRIYANADDTIDAEVWVSTPEEIKDDDPFFDITTKNGQTDIILPGWMQRKITLWRRQRHVSEATEQPEMPLFDNTARRLGVSAGSKLDLSSMSAGDVKFHAMNSYLYDAYVAFECHYLLENDYEGLNSVAVTNLSGRVDAKTKELIWYVDIVGLDRYGNWRQKETDSTITNILVPAWMEAVVERARRKNAKLAEKNMDIQPSLCRSLPKNMNTRHISKAKSRIPLTYPSLFRKTSQI